MTRSPLQQETSRRNGSRGRGPASAQGRQRASANALRHGLRAERVSVLAHEDPEAYHSYEAVWEDALHPASEAERQVMNRIVFLRWQLRRFDQVDERRQQAEVAARLGDTGEAKRLHVIEGALAALRLMVDVMEKSAFPAGRDVLDGFLTPVAGVIEMVQKVEDGAPDRFVGLAGLVDAVNVLKMLSQVKTDVEAYREVGARARSAAAAVETLIPPAQAAVEVAREKIVLDHPLPGDRDVALRARYMRHIEKQLMFEVQFLAQLRELGARRGISGSFGTHTET